MMNLDELLPILAMPVAGHLAGCSAASGDLAAGLGEEWEGLVRQTPVLAEISEVSSA